MIYDNSIRDIKVLKTKYVETNGSNFESNGTNSNVVFIPYILQERTEESSKEYDDFMNKYKENHKYCPKCGHDSHRTTLLGFNLNRKEEYKDLNRSTCMKCGDIHRVHDRV
jgi:ribosomal protein S27AE